MYWKIFTQWFLNCSLSIQQQKKINSIALSVKKKFSESPSLLYYNSVLKPSRKQLFDWYRSISFWEPKRKWFQLFLIIIFHYYTSAENWKNHKKSFFPPIIVKLSLLHFWSTKLIQRVFSHNTIYSGPGKLVLVYETSLCVYVIVEGGTQGFMLNCFSYCFHLTTSSFFYHNIIRLWSYLLRIKISLIFMLMLIMVQWVAFFDIFSYSRPSKEIWNENRGTYQGMYMYYTSK